MILLGFEDAVGNCTQLGGELVRLTSREQFKKIREYKDDHYNVDEMNWIDMKTDFAFGTGKPRQY